MILLVYILCPYKHNAAVASISDVIVANSNNTMDWARKQRQILKEN